tara:strand:+ start:98 stop:589 length:492 start_codon:yes stop_codon:yes gene_type:complete
MYNLLFDSDALIKLTYSESIFKICETFNCLITKEIQEETVVEGKKRLYPDAIKIEKLIIDKKLKVKNSKKTIKTKENFGVGEESILRLYNTFKKGIIVTDDLAFIKYLESNNIIFIIPTDLIIILNKLKKINYEEAIYFLDKIKVFIKEEVYNETKKELKEDI